MTTPLAGPDRDHSVLARFASTCGCGRKIEIGDLIERDERGKWCCRSCAEKSRRIAATVRAELEQGGER